MAKNIIHIIYFLFSFVIISCRFGGDSVTNQKVLPESVNIEIENQIEDDFSFLLINQEVNDIQEQIIIQEPTRFIPLRDKVSQTFNSEIGVREHGGNNKGEKVEEYLRSTNLGPGFAWCAAFVHWVYRKNNVETEKANAWSPSWFPVHKTTYKRGKDLQNDPKKSDVFGLYYPNLKRIGHVGFVDEDSKFSKY